MYYIHLTKLICIIMDGDCIMSNVKEKLFENRKILLIGIVVLIVIFGIFSLLFRGTNSMVIFSDSSKISKEFEKLNDSFTDKDKKYPEVDISDNKFEYTDINEIIKVFDNKDDAVIFFGYPSCLYCRTAIQVLHDTSMGTEIDKILYLNVEEIKDGYDVLLGKLDNKFKVVESGEEIIYSPLVMFIADGKIATYHEGTLFSQYSPYSKLDQSQIDGLSEIFRNGINDVVNGIKNNK